MLELTQHAKVRMQQRGITATTLESLLDYGAQANDHRGGTILFRFKAKVEREFDKMIDGVSAERAGVPG